MENNPYQTPESLVEMPQGDSDAVLLEPNKMSASDGATWLTRGGSLFMTSPLVWVAMNLVYWLLFLGLSIIPLISIVVYIFTPVMTAGFMIASRRAATEGRVEFGDLFGGFDKAHFSNLLAVGGLYFAGMIGVGLITMIVVLLFVGGDLFTLMASASDPDNVDPDLALSMIGGIMAGVLVFAVIVLPLVMSIWFAPVLVVEGKLSPLDAMRLSVTGCLRNIWPLTVFGLLLLVLFVVATLPVFLGWLVVGPIMNASLYASFRDIYTNEPLS